MTKKTAKKPALPAKPKKLYTLEQADQLSAAARARGEADARRSARQLHEDQTILRTVQRLENARMPISAVLTAGVAIPGGNMDIFAITLGELKFLARRAASTLDSLPQATTGNMDKAR